MRAIVLGAGASYGASDNHNGIPCPLVDRVLETASRLGLTDQAYGEAFWDRFEAEVRAAGGDLQEARARRGMEANEHLGALKGFVQQQLGVSPDEYLTTRVDFERVMGLVEGEVLGAHELLRLYGGDTGQPGPADVLDQQLHLTLCGSLVATTTDIQCAYHGALAR